MQRGEGRWRRRMRGASCAFEAVQRIRREPSLAPARARVPAYGCGGSWRAPCGPLLFAHSSAVSRPPARHVTGNTCTALALRCSSSAAAVTTIAPPASQPATLPPASLCTCSACATHLTSPCFAARPHAHSARILSDRPPHLQRRSAHWSDTAANPVQSVRGSRWCPAPTGTLKCH